MRPDTDATQLKPTASSPPIDTAPPVARPTARPSTKPSGKLLTETKRGRHGKDASKQAKKN